MDAFDADVLIYAATRDHPLGRRVLHLLSPRPAESNEPTALTGSVLLLPEILSKPLREGAHREVDALLAILSRLALLPTDQATADLATVLAANYRLRAADAVHLATAVNVGADRFITNNRSDFSSSISEIAITYPDDLDD